MSSMYKYINLVWRLWPLKYNNNSSVLENQHCGHWILSVIIYIWNNKDDHLLKHVGTTQLKYVNVAYFTNWLQFNLLIFKCNNNLYNFFIIDARQHPSAKTNLHFIIFFKFSWHGKRIKYAIQKQAKPSISKVQ